MNIAIVQVGITSNDKCRELRESYQTDGRIVDWYLYDDKEYDDCLLELEVEDLKPFYDEVVVVKGGEIK